MVMMIRWASHLSNETVMTLAGIFVLLVLSSLITIGIRFRSPGDTSVELRERVRTWWVIVAMFAVALGWSVTAAIAWLGLVSFLALKELLSMTPTRRADRRVLFYAYLSVPIQYWFAGSAWYGMFIIFIPVMMFVALPTRMWMIGVTSGFLRAASVLHWALMLTVFSLSHAAFLLVLSVSPEGRLVPHGLAGPQAEQLIRDVPEAVGPALLLFLLVMTEANDIFGYLWGKSLGRSQVAPTVSPGKTQAGLVGGVATTMAVAWVLGPWLTIMDGPRSLMAGAIIGVGGFAGDLCLSSIKRDLSIKDFGATLPGHGGVLDRVDSLIFTAPLFFHFVYYLYG